MREAVAGLLTFILCALSIFPVLADSTGVTENSIKIGVFGPITGPASIFSKTVYGPLSVYKDINDKGGIYGRKIELLIEDDSCEPTKGIGAVKKLIANDVFLLHGAFCTAVALAVKQEIVSHPEIPYMVIGAASASISKPVLPNLFQPVPTSETTSRQMAEFSLSKPGVKRIAVIRHTEEWGTAFSEPAIALLKERGFDPLVVNLERGSTDATPQTLTIKNAQPDVVLAALYPPEFALYMRTAYKYGVKVTTVTTNVDTIEDTDKRLGIPAAMNDVFVGYTLKAIITSPELAPYTNIFRKYYPSEVLDPMSLHTMTGALAVVEALKRVGPNLTRKAFLAELNKLQHFAPGVFSGEVSFNPHDHAAPKTIRFVALVKRKPVLFDKYPGSLKAVVPEQELGSQP
jgi:branched-chain amino acid transport system substrate-binding protein